MSDTADRDESDARRADRDQAADPRVLDRDWLCSRLFSFSGRADRPVYASALRFERHGRIGGYAQRNESSWRLDDGRLTILRDDGVPSCIASPVRNADGTISFVGRFLLSDREITHRFDENTDYDGLPTAFSFDLFDTLVARRCHDPVAIFDAVERKAGVGGFARLRREVESTLWRAGDYAFDDIYAALGAAARWPERILQRLRVLELAEEWSNLFPIQESILRVLPGDLIVSDMYLPEGFLRRIVEEKCGLEGCRIFVSSHGKSRGEIWSRIGALHRILRHHGDNPHSDVESARRAKLNTEHVTLAAWTRGERILRDADLGDFAAIIREARLRSFDSDPLVRSAQLAQFDLNIPLLIVAGLYALGRARERGVDTLLMCSRDCNLWFHLLRWMAARTPQSPVVRYFLSSRVLLLANDPDYQAYYSHLRGTRNMIVDVSGTGRSMAHFLAQMDDRASASVFLLAGTTAVGEVVKDPPPDDAPIEILTQNTHDRRLAIESLNMSLEGRSHEIEFNGHSFEAHCLSHEFGSVSQSMITGMRTVFLDVISRFTQAESLKLPADRPLDALRSTAEAVLELVAQHRSTCSPILRDIWDAEKTREKDASAARRRIKAPRVRG